MSRRAANLLLFAAAAFLVPLPFWLVESGCAPAAHLAALTGAMFALIAAEGPRGVVGIAAALLLIQLALQLVALRVAAALATRGLAHVAPRRLGAAAAAVIAVGVVLAATFPLYRTPFRTASLHASLFEIFE